MDHFGVKCLLLLLALSKSQAKAATCTDDSDCSTNEYCNSGNCTCIVNHIESGGSCIQKPCSTFNPSVDCDPNSDCDAMDKCVCDFGFVSDRGLCRKECGVDNDCGSEAERACLDGKCYCKATFTGDGQTCNPTSCTCDDECSSNQFCNEGSCSCLVNTAINALTCIRKNCTGNASVECGENTACVKNETEGTLQCQCALFHHENGTECTSIVCTENGNECGENASCEQDACVCDAIDETTGLCKSGAVRPEITFRLYAFLSISSFFFIK